jgi:hypothetical protein
MRRASNFSSFGRGGYSAGVGFVWGFLLSGRSVTDRLGARGQGWGTLHEAHGGRRTGQASTRTREARTRMSYGHARGMCGGIAHHEPVFTIMAPSFGACPAVGGGSHAS